MRVDGRGESSRWVAGFGAKNGGGEKHMAKKYVNDAELQRDHLSTRKTTVESSRTTHPRGGDGAVNAEQRDCLGRAGEEVWKAPAREKLNHTIIP